MAIPVKRKLRVLKAEYIDDAQSILIQGQYKEGLVRHQIHRDCFFYGNRSEEEIVKELQKTAEMMIGKEIEIVYDPELDDKIKDKVSIKYR